jgi:hypothetical protein
MPPIVKLFLALCLNRYRSTSAPARKVSINPPNVARKSSHGSIRTPRKLASSIPAPASRIEEEIRSLMLKMPVTTTTTAIKAVE